MSLPKIISGRRKRIFLRLLLVSILEACCLFLVSIMIKLVAINLSSSEHSIALIYLALGLLAVSGMLAFCYWIGSSLSEHMGMDYSSELRLALFNSVVSTSTMQQRNRLGSTMARMLGDLNAVRDWVASGLPTAMISIGTLIAACGVLFTIDWKLGGLIALLFITFYSIILLIGISLIRDRYILLRQLRGRLSGHLADLISGAASINHFNRSTRERSRLNKHNHRLTQTSVSRARISALMSALPSVTVPLSIGLIALIISAGYKFEIGDIGTWSALLFALALFASSAFALTRALDQFIAFCVARKRLLELLSHADALNQQTIGSIKLKKNKAISINIPPLQKPNINLEEPLYALAGENILLNGPTGSGKSTLLKLLHISGRDTNTNICMNQLPISALSPRSLAQRIQLVSPSIPLLRGSIARNITYGVRSTNSNWLKKVIEICQLNDIISLTELNSFRIEHGGENIASGIVTRLRLARALYTRPGLLLIDDPAFLYDAEAQTALIRAKQALDMTLVISAPNNISIPNLYFDRYWQLHNTMSWCSQTTDEDSD